MTWKQTDNETIRAEAGDADAWICVCGNTPSADGFFPCTASGEEVEPTEQDWPEPWSVCRRCSRIIHAPTRQVVGVRGDGVRRLPTVAGYTVDHRLREFRRVRLTKQGDRTIEFIPFASAKGRRLLKRLQGK